MHTQFDVRDIKKMTVEQVQDADKGIYFSYILELKDFPGAMVPIDEKEYARLSRSFNRRMKRGELIEA